MSANFVKFSILEYCNSCNQGLILKEERERLTYKNQSIFIRKVMHNIDNNESLSDSTSEKNDDDSSVRINRKQNFYKN